MDDLLQEIDQRCRLIASSIGCCCVWKRSQFCLTEHRMSYSYMHRHPFCDRMKQEKGISVCRKNDTELIMRHLQRDDRRPFLHKCHGGAVELVIPVHRAGRILGCILCGPFAHGDTTDPALPPWRECLKDSLPVLADLLLGDLLERYYSHYPECRKMDRRIEKALNYIAANYSRQLTLTEVAAAVFLSPSRLSHLFKEDCGIDFSGYLCRLRLMVARDLLRQTAIGVGEIAFQTGFSSQQHLTTMFKKFFKETPTQHRKRCGRAPN